MNLKNVYVIIKNLNDYSICNIITVNIAILSLIY